MIEDVRKFVDTLFKKKLKLSKGDYKKAGIPPPVSVGTKQVNDYYGWLYDVTGQSITTCLPENDKGKYFFEILNLEPIYKQKLKSLCDSNHPAMDEVFQDLNVPETLRREIVENIKRFPGEYLDYYDLFKDENDSFPHSWTSVHKMITQLSLDSSQGNIISHSAKMTNPGCKYPRIKVGQSKTIGSKDGFLRTGNAYAPFDLHINATKLKVFKFLSLRHGNLNMLELIREDNEKEIAKLFSTQTAMAQEWIHNFTACIHGEDKQTHEGIKQVYFPVEEGDYHLLSLLTPSGLVFTLKEKIDAINDRSSTAYSGKKALKSKQFYAPGFSTISDLTVTRHGGDHPKNISGLNNKYQNYYLLKSAPPELKKRIEHFPKQDFFTQSVRYRNCTETFQNLHNLYSKDHNNMRVRAERDECYLSIMDYIVERMWQLRAVAREQYNPDYHQLPKTQRIWLLEEHGQTREDSDDWLEDITGSITQFIFHGYEKILGKKALKFSDTEKGHIAQRVEQYREILR